MIGLTVAAYLPNVPDSSNCEKAALSGRQTVCELNTRPESRLTFEDYSRTETDYDELTPVQRIALQIRNLFQVLLVLPSPGKCLMETSLNRNRLHFCSGSATIPALMVAPRNPPPNSQAESHFSSQKLLRFVLLHAGQPPNSSVRLCNRKADPLSKRDRPSSDAR